MKKPLITLCIVATLGSSVVGEAAASGGRHGGYGHGGHFGGDFGHHSYGGHSSSNFGLYFGDPFFWGPSPFYQNYAPDYYRAPSTVIIEREPPVYIQRQPQPQQQAQAAPLWYYCPNPAGYYPQIANCSQQWVPVDPRSVPPR